MVSWSDHVHVAVHLTQGGKVGGPEFCKTSLIFCKHPPPPPFPHSSFPRNAPDLREVSENFRRLVYLRIFLEKNPQEDALLIVVRLAKMGRKVILIGG